MYSKVWPQTTDRLVLGLQGARLGRSQSSNNEMSALQHACIQAQQTFDIPGAATKTLHFMFNHVQPYGAAPAPEK